MTPHCSYSKAALCAVIFLCAAIAQTTSQSSFKFIDEGSQKLAKTDVDYTAIPQGASSLAFVFDITGSMYDDLVQVIEGAAKILATTLARRVKPLYNYVLVPFHDPDIGPVTVTTDPGAFQRDLRDLYVQGGGDCPEMSVGAIKMALEVSLPNSYIYVFTDARAKDFVLVEQVLTLIQQKQTQVVFVMTGDCGNTSHPGFKAYEQIASTSSGQIFLLSKPQVNQILDVVRVAINSRKVNLISLDRAKADQVYLELPIDTKLKEFTVSISGLNPTIDIIDPNGVHIKNSDIHVKELLKLKNALVINIKDPLPGVWKLNLSSETAHTIRITGLSTLDFIHGFSRKPTLDIHKTKARPIKGVQTHMLLNSTGLKFPGRLTTVDFMDLLGNKIMEIPVTYNEAMPSLYNISAFSPPDDFFYITVNGLDPKGYDFKRSTPTAISPVVPDPPNIHMDKTTRGYYDKTAILTCSVTSLVPYTVEWYRDREPLGGQLFYLDSANVTYSIPDASSFSEGVYSCNASNTAGYAIAETYLDVRDPPPVIQQATNTSAVPGHRTLLHCDAFSTVDFNYTWYRAADGMNLAEWDKATVFSNGTVEIVGVEKTDEGAYVCRATNEGGSTDQEIWLLVEKAPIVTIDPPSASFTTGMTLNLTCTSIAYPVPLYHWEYRGTTLERTQTSWYDDRGLLVLSDLTQGREGEYVCVANNVAGEGRAMAEVTFMERPLIGVTDDVVLVNNGDKAVLQCDAYGIPKPNITWYRGDIELRELSFIKIESDGSLHILGTQSVDAGEYRCVATNDAGSTEATILLDIGSAPIITHSPSSVGVEVLTNTTLPCAAIGKPQPEIIWTRMDGTLLDFNGSRYEQLPTGALRIHGAMKEDEGMYTCTVKNEFGSKHVSAFVSITGIVRPLIAYNNPNIEVIQGRSLQLSCIVLLGNPQPTVMWMKMGERVAPDERILSDGHGTLTVLSALPEDEGEYTCVASNVGGNATYVAKVDVQVPPEIEDSARDFTVSQHRSITLPCIVSGDPHPAITWTKNGVRISETDPHYFINIDGSLEIFTADPRDTATYSCTALNIAGVKEKRMTLFVQIPPLITDNMHDFTVIIDNPIQLPCEVIGIPPPQISWLREGVQIEETDEVRFLPNGAFRINRVKIDDEGLYECLATNEAGNDSKIVTVTVQVPPTLVSVGPTELIVTAGQEAILDCETIGSPHPMVDWRKDLIKINFFDEESKYLIQESGNLFIPETTVDDTARFLCIAENPAGVITREIQLIVHEPPYVPANSATNTTIIENNRVTIPCPAEGTPQPIITWFKGTRLLTGNEIGVRFLADGALQLDNALAKDSGMYYCLAENIAGNVTHSVELVVFLPPRFTDNDDNNSHSGGYNNERNLDAPTNEREDAAVTHNNTIHLSCPASANPPPQISWYKDGEELSYQIYDENQRGRIQILDEGRVLMIQNSELGDTARYTCIARNSVGEGEKVFTVQVQVPPSIDGDLVSDKNLSVIANQALVIDCPAEGVPTPKVTWYKNEREIYPENEPTLRIMSGGRRLEIIGADVLDTGVYKCVAHNAAGKTVNNFTVDVYVPAKIDGSEEVANPEVVVGGNITLFCPASGTPLPDVDWWHGGQRLRRNTTRFYVLDDGWQLMILDADIQDTSRFSCRARNAGGESEKYFDLNVLVPPKIDRTDIDTNPKVILNRTVIINCPVSGIPAPEIQWYRAGEVIVALTNPGVTFVGGGRQLRINSAQLSDTGLYQCLVVNKAGDDSVEYALEVHIPTVIDRFGVKLEHEVVENHTALLDCPAVGVPVPNITWYHNGQQIDFTLALHLRPLDDGRQLEITRAMVADSGVYECRASNDAGNDHVTYGVAVHVPPFIDANTSSEAEIQVIINRTQIITCDADGIPPPEIFWLMNGQPVLDMSNPRYRILQSGRQLEIFKSEVPDTGRYTCIARNAAGASDREFDLTVLVPPYIDDSNLIREPRVIEGKVVTLHCPAMGIPFPNVTWLKENEPVVPSSRLRVLLSGRQLELVDVEEDDTARYTCVAQNIAGESKKDFDLHVLIPPSIDEANLVDNPRVNMNRTVLLECPVDGIPPPKVTWLKNGEPLVLVPGLRLIADSRQLEIERAQVEDTARYTCLATNEAGKLTRNFDLEVYVPPSIPNSDEVQVIQVVENRTVYINCLADGIPPPSILWLRGYELLFDFPRSNIRELSNGRQLEVRNVQVSDEGDYKCTATNAAGQKSKSFRLEVQVPPRIPGSRYTTDLEVINRRSISMECNPTGDPEPEIKWLKGSELVDPSTDRSVRLLRGDRILQIIAAAPEDAGKYTCIAVNVAGEEQRQFDLKVHVPPEIQDSLLIEEKSVAMGNTLTMECLTRGVPEPSIKWLREGVPFSFLTNPNLRVLEGGKRLQVINAQLLDIGGYTCVASNVAGNASKEYILAVQVPPTIEDGPSQVVATVNTRTMLMCETLGLPEPTMTWHKDGQLIANSGFRYRVRRSGSLEFSSVRVDDSGVYTCKAENAAGDVSRQIELSVQVPPVIHNSREDFVHSVVAGETVELPCDATGFPEPKIIWQKATRAFSNSSGYSILPSGSLHVKSAELRDAGIYVCIAENGAGSDLGQIRLEVQVPPTIEEQQTEYTVIENRKVILPCRANGMPAPEVWWEKDGQKISRVDFQYRLLRSGWLAIPVARVGDSGSYTCIAENGAGRVSLVMDLVVQVPPTIEPSDRMITINKGDNASLPCVATGTPPPEISWIQDGRTVIRKDSHYHVEEAGNLVIKNVEETDAGSYVCTAKNRAGRKSKEVLLRVQVPPSFTKYPKDQEVMAGGRIELSCAAEGIPQPSIRWLVNNKPYNIAPSYNGRSRLLIDNAGKRDDGTYLCVAENLAGERKALAAVRVKVPPKVLITQDSQAVTLDSRVILNCPIEGGDPPPEIWWLKNGRQVIYDGRVQKQANGSLVIYDSTANDAGEYKCVASNDAGKDEGIALLTVNTPPVFVIEPQSTIVEQGRIALINCVAKGEPDPDVFWKVGNVRLHTGERLAILPNNSLMIVGVQPGDSGQYICQARNDYGSELVVAQLTVMVHGSWSYWGAWSQCGATCGFGTQERVRTCSNPEPANGGDPCHGTDVEIDVCNAGDCPIHGAWSEWSLWEACSKTCGLGEQTRSRECNSPVPQHGGLPCRGDSVETLICDQGPCPVNGDWGDWSQYSGCSATCGDGSKVRYRRCDNPRAENGGRECLGRDEERTPCREQDCEVHGGWGEWTRWTSCSLSCDGGTRTRRRRCDSPRASNGGRECSGTDQQIDYCNKEPCPVHGHWSDWSPWGDCTMTCDRGQRRRFRTCSNPPPKHNGRPCIGVSQDTQVCNDVPCAVDGEWGVWSSWSRCTQTCDSGDQQRYRVCKQPQYGGVVCTGDPTQTRKCNVHPCKAGIPRRAQGSIIGSVNNHEFGVSRLFANISRTGKGTKVAGLVIDVPDEVGHYLQHLLSLMSPVYWTTATEVGEAINGYTLTLGEFKRHSQVQFSTGEVLEMTHVARGLDKDGTLQFDVLLKGDIPEISPVSDIVLLPYVEDYIQTGPGSLYASSSRLFRVDGHTFPYAWNHTITYSPDRGRQPYLVQRLRASDLHVEFDPSDEVMEYMVTASIARGEPSNTCPKGFFLDADGPYCQDDDECDRLAPCSHKCHNTPGSYYCSCPDGFVISMDGNICKDENECVGPGLCSHTCVNVPGSYMCSCPLGLSLGADLHTCEDVDECDRSIAECYSSQDCINTVGSYQCLTACGAGFRRTPGSLSCEDINECLESPDVCPQACVNVRGGHKCGCEEGYRLVGTDRCEDVNECSEGTAPCSDGCDNTPGSYKCHCRHGYRLQAGRRCTDIDECAIGQHKCAPDQECSNTDGGYTCESGCNHGYVKHRNGTCIDRDECSLREHQCLYDQECVNTVGGYQCTCPRGYRSPAIGQPCVDIDECAMIPSPCSYRCVNRRGTYECRCPFGQKLLADRKSCAGLRYTNDQQYGVSTLQCPTGYRQMNGECVDIDECESSSRCQHSCENTPGSFRCTCPSGYRLSANGRTCQDIDECTELKVECGPNKMCFNRRGDFQCIRTPCPPRYDRDPNTGSCVLPCSKAKRRCPPGARYADIIQFMMLPLANGIQAGADLVRLKSLDHQDVHQHNAHFTIIENDKNTSFDIRNESGKGVVFTLKPLEEKKSYTLKVRAKSTDHRRRGHFYKTTFMLFISVSMYPY